MKVILVIEDEALLLAVYRRILKRDYAVITVSSLEAAEGVIRGDPQIDLILSDTSLGDGFSHTLHAKVADLLNERGVTWIAMSGSFEVTSHRPSRDYYLSAGVMMVDKDDISPTSLLRLVFWQFVK